MFLICYCPLYGGRLYVDTLMVRDHISNTLLLEIWAQDSRGCASSVLDSLVEKSDIIIQSFIDSKEQIIATLWLKSRWDITPVIGPFHAKTLDKNNFYYPDRIYHMWLNKLRCDQLELLKNHVRGEFILDTNNESNNESSEGIPLLQASQYVELDETDEDDQHLSFD